MDISDQLFLRAVGLYLFGLFLFAGEPDLNDALISHLMNHCPVVTESD